MSKDVDYYAEQLEKNPKAFIFKLIGFLFLIGIFIGAISFVIGIFSQPARIISKTLDADNVLYNYEWFKTQYEDVLAIDIKIKNASSSIKLFKEDAGARSSWTFEDKNESSRLRTILLGLENQREDMVAVYNARSKMANRSMFKTNELPHSIN